MAIPTTETPPPNLSADALLSPKFSNFTVTSTPYKIINGQEIPVHIFIPKDIQPGKHPILARFHGGFLITGAALYPDFTPQWALDYSVQQSAIWVAPDYRLLPESNGLDILSDLQSFWIWVKRELPGYLRSIGRSNVEPDYEHVMAYGESAGGYLALQTALTQGDLVKAVIAAFPMVDLDSPWYSEKVEGKSPFEAPVVPKEILEKHIENNPNGKIAVSGFPPDRVPLALVAIQQGLFTDMFGRDDILYPLRVLEKTRLDKVPFLFTYHGTDDRAVPFVGTQRFAREWEEKFGKDSITATFRPGDHGVGNQDSLEEPWLKKGLEGVTKAWLD
jgi:acetyl esterase/lipase